MVCLGVMVGLFSFEFLLYVIVVIGFPILGSLLLLLLMNCSLFYSCCRVWGS